MRVRRVVAIALVATGVMLALAGGAGAATDPPGCTQTVQYDPSIPTFEDVVGVPLGDGPPGPAARRPTSDLYAYLDAVAAATANNTRVRVVKRSAGTTTLGRDIPYVVVGTPEHIAALDADAAFWRSAREGTAIEPALLAAAGNHPAFAWVTANIHGNEPAGGEASERLLYELAARTDCANAQRLASLDVFIMPSENPDGRDVLTRESAWGFDLNRDWHTLTQRENRLKIAAGIEFPGLAYIDAHQQTSGYFFPPNEDPVHHEISDFAIDLIQNDIGPSLQRRFNDQSIAYQNYNTYDLFTPEYGDSVPSLLFGAAGMTFEKGITENYGKQVYDHYLAMDETINVLSREKPRLAEEWIEQWFEAEAEGAAGELEPNQLVSPLHTTITQQPSGSVYGYFLRPENHTGDAARLAQQLLDVGVHVYRLDASVTVPGLHEFGPPGTQTEVLPAGTLWIPSGQTQKHWIQAVLGEDPFIPFPYFYDVVTWSFSLLRGMSGDGYLTQPMPGGAAVTEITEADLGGVEQPSDDVYAFATDSAQGLALAIELLDAGATVYRAADAFDEAGHDFPTGTALVDATSVTSSSVDLDALADERDVPVVGLEEYPVDRYAIAKPKIGVYTGLPAVPPNPTSPVPSHCQALAYGPFCEALYVLTEKLGLPDGSVVPVTSTELEAGALLAQGFTALIVPNEAAPSPQGAAQLQVFVNAGGRYVGAGSTGTTTARTAGMTNVNTQSISGLTTPGSTFNATFETASPLAWGFDNGGFVYRSANGDPVYNPATLAGSPPAIPNATAAASYASPLTSFGYHVNAVGPGKLDGRPVVIDQPLGSGRVSLLGFNPFFRGWVDGEERLALNGALYPTGSPIAPSATAQEVRAARRPASDPLPRRTLRSVRRRPVRGRDTSRDIRIQVLRTQLPTLRRAVATAELPPQVAGRVRYSHGRRVALLEIRRVRTDDNEARSGWTGLLMGAIEAAGIRPIYAQL